MPVTPDMARDARGQGTADNRGQRQSASRGRDTVGTGGSVIHPDRSISAKGRVEQTEKPMGFDKRSNTVHGAPKEQPYDARNGARMVGDVMLAQEPKGRDETQRTMDREAGQAKSDHTGRPGSQQFTIEPGNHAKTIR